MSTLRFADRYYGGPFLPVANPDRDLPRRDPAVPIADNVRARVEFSGNVGSERIIAPFRDANTADAILGDLLLAEGYPESWNQDERVCFPTIQGLLAKVADRLQEKAARAQGPRRAWLSEAHSSIQRAAGAYAAGQYAMGCEAVRECSELIRGSSRSRQRRAAIYLGPGRTRESD